ncbi:MAG TPA: glycosyltransferase family 4 protein [Anaerolineaceae bacterium]|nr:glycosyltransferase family 4 protein [Anaerolineaceae bacterium]
MNILISATYFEPYSSGLSQYALRLGRGLVALGNQVTVLTSQYQKQLPLEEEIFGLHVVRVPVDFRLSKGVFMLGLSKIANPWIKWADVVNLHLPQFESAILAGLVKSQGKRLVVTYQCDLEKEGSILTQLPFIGTRMLHTVALKKADVIVQMTQDYAETSPAIQNMLTKVRIVVPPINPVVAQKETIQGLRNKFSLDENHRYIGLSGRVASEKGYQTLVEALPEIHKKFPDTVVLHAGSWKGVVGEEAYQAKIDSLIKPYENNWRKLGFLSDDEFRAFFAICDLLVVSSTNRTEAFGMVQIEAFGQGTPVVASNSPGIRVPVTKSGAGALFKAGDPISLTEKICQVLEKGKAAYPIKPEFLQEFSEESVAKKYLEIYKN